MFYSTCRALFYIISKLIISVCSYSPKNCQVKMPLYIIFNGATKRYVSISVAVTPFPMIVLFIGWPGPVVPSLPGRVSISAHRITFAIAFCS